MNVFKKFKYCCFITATILKIPRSRFNVFTILLLLRAVVLVTIDAIDPTSVSIRNIEDDGDEHPVCGKVTTKTFTGDVVVTLREGLTLSEDEFQKLHSGKLTNATFSPAGDSCVIQVCGFKSWGPPLQEGLIGSDCDYGDCKIFEQEGHAPRDIFDELYNTSSISCACQKQVDGCYYNCHKRATEQEDNWGENGCAILYQELACNNCYFEPIVLSIGQNYSTDVSHHIRSLLIRDSCTVKQYIPALKRMARFANMSQPIIHYHYYPIESTMNTSFISEPEHFHCVCGEPPPPTTPRPTRRPPTTPIPPSPPPATPGPVAVGLIAGGITIAVIISTTSFLIWRKRKLSNSHTHLREEDTASMSVLEESCDNSDKGSTICSPTVETNENNDSLKNDNDIPANNPLYGNQLKKEIVDEVRNVLESHYLWMRKNQESSRMQFERAEERPTTSSTCYSYTSDNDAFSLMFDKFLQCCPDSLILTQGEFTVPDKSLEVELGSGLFGIVYRGLLQSRTDGLWREAAVKKMRNLFSKDNDAQMKSFLREIKTFVDLGEGNENIVKFLGASCYGGRIYILTELCERGSLQEHLLKEMRPNYFDDKKVNEVTIDVGDNYCRQVEHTEEVPSTAKKPLTNDDYLKLMNICQQIANGMLYLSSKGIVHVDLKGGNILVVIDKTTKTIKTVKISDFGLSRTCFNMDDCARSLVMGDFPYNSLVPEGITKDPNDPKKVSLSVDIWAFACTVWQIFSLGLSSYSNLKEEGFNKMLAVIELLLTEKHDTECRCHPKPELAPDFVYHKLLECWNPEPKGRPRFQELYDFFEVQESHEYSETEM